MHSPRLYKYQDSVPYHRRTLFWYTDTHKWRFYPLVSLGKVHLWQCNSRKFLYKMSLCKVPLVKFQTSLKIFTVGASSTSAVVMCCPLLSTGSLVRNSSTDVSLLGPEPIVCYKDVPGLTNKKIHLYDLGPKLTNYVNYIQHKLILTKYCFWTAA